MNYTTYVIEQFLTNDNDICWESMKSYTELSVTRAEVNRLRKEYPANKYQIIKIMHSERIVR